MIIIQNVKINVT